jgi:radical SAM superfamily enzyme YgiQ (UPF0313 family)
MAQQILLVNPPFTQLNTPYPATTYIKGFLNTQDIASDQMDLGMETILSLFSKQGLTLMFSRLLKNIEEASFNSQRIFRLQKQYINTVTSVIDYLQDQDPTLAHLICTRNFLPEASKFEQTEDTDWAFGAMGIKDKARHFATLYLEDLSDFIIEMVDPNFGFSRYAERIAMSANSFDELYNILNNPTSFVGELMTDLLKQKMEETKPTMVCLSVPFPGNLLAALTCGKWIKTNYPGVTVVMGGGYPNTELRSLSDPRVFECVDFICLDDGELPLLQLIKLLDNEIDTSQLKRTFACSNGVVEYHNQCTLPDFKQNVIGTPDYTGLNLKKYLSVIQLTNPMHRLWSDGRWNKLTMAHGCYWGKCTFCDISLDYIKRYEGSTAKVIVDRMETLIAQTGERGFHFVDEAAPPALMKSIALEILSRNLVVSWWANIRFEKSFNYDLCRLLAASGCIAISGGLEVASDRLLKLIDKGVTVEQVSQVNSHLNKAGIMVHAYLMYGFPTQTDQETIDSLEVVRQMFEANILQSAFWHQFAMTAHSPVGLNPEKFKVKNVNPTLGTFANNDLVHQDLSGAKHEKFSEGLKKSLYNYMHGVGLDLPLQEWFGHKVPKTTTPKSLIKKHLNSTLDRFVKPNSTIVWIGGPISYLEQDNVLVIETKQESLGVDCDQNIGNWLVKTLPTLTPNQNEPLTYNQLQEKFEANGFDDFTTFWNTEIMNDLKEIGLLYL